MVLLTRLASLPRTPWESDEFHFMEAVRNFDPSRYHPHPPGYPLFVALGKLVNLFTNDPFTSLVFVSVVSCVIGYVALAMAFRRWLDDDGDLANAGALVFYLSAGMLVHSSIAMADSATLMFLALAFYASSCFPEAPTERRALAIGLWSACAIGCRPQIAIALVPALAVQLIWLRTMRLRALAAGAFAFACLMWFIPLMDAAGGWSGLVAYEVKQAAYFAEHDAAMSRGTMSAAAIAMRFIAHPWGSKIVFLPLFLSIAAGLAAFVKSIRPRLIPLLVFTIIHLGFALIAMDPADGVRYSLPSMILFALVAACGFGAIRRLAQLDYAPWIAAAFFGLVSWWYVHPIIHARTHGPSPVAAAADYAKQHFAPGTVVAYDLSLRPQAEYLLPQYKTMKLDDALSRLYDTPATPVVMLVDGGSQAAEAKVFSWPDSDAYGKLTRNHYRQVTLDPVRPAERYLPISGVYALERTVDGLEWRWLQREAVLRLPSRHQSSAVLAFRLSGDAPYAATGVHVLVNGSEAARVDAKRNEVATAAVPLPPAGDVVLRIVSDQSFAPAQVLRNRDPRLLAVQLVHLDER